MYAARSRIFHAEFKFPDFSISIGARRRRFIIQIFPRALQRLVCTPFRVITDALAHLGARIHGDAASETFAYAARGIEMNPCLFASRARSLARNTHMNHNVARAHHARITSAFFVAQRVQFCIFLYVCVC